MTDPRELREAALARLAEGPIHTRYHAVNEAIVERQERLQPPRTRDADLPAVGSFHG